MKTPEQLKGAVRNISKNNNLFPQEVLQMFFFERFLERLFINNIADFLDSLFVGCLIYGECSNVFLKGDI